MQARNGATTNERMWMVYSLDSNTSLEENKSISKVDRLVLNKLMNILLEQTILIYIKMKNGMPILIFPKGTRNRSLEHLNSFYGRAFRLAIEQKVPILVNILIDLDKITNPSKRWYLHSGVIHCRWDGPIETDDLSLNELEDLKLNVRSIMLGHLNIDQKIVP